MDEILKAFGNQFFPQHNSLLTSERHVSQLMKSLEMGLYLYTLLLEEGCMI